MTVTEIQTDAGRGRTVLAVATLVLGIAGLVLAFMAMMGLFLGAEGPGMRSLLAFTAWLLLPAGGLALLCLRGLRGTGRGVVATCWSRLPAWLVIAIALMVLLAMLAQLAIWLVEFTGGGSVPADHYLPIIAVLVYALAVAAGYAPIAPPGADGEHRGPVRHTDPVRRDPD